MRIKDNRFTKQAELEFTDIKNTVQKSPKSLFYLDISMHPNIGDLAQYCYISEWFKKNYKGYVVIEISPQMIATQKKNPSVS